MINEIKVITFWRYAAEDFMDDLSDDYGYEIEKTVIDNGFNLEWTIKFSDINESREVLIDRLERWLSHYWWFLNIE